MWKNLNTDIQSPMESSSGVFSFLPIFSLLDCDNVKTYFEHLNMHRHIQHSIHKRISNKERHSFSKSNNKIFFFAYFFDGWFFFPYLAILIGLFVHIFFLLLFRVDNNVGNIFILIESKIQLDFSIFYIEKDVDMISFIEKKLY